MDWWRQRRDVICILLVLFALCFVCCIIPMDCLTFGGLFKGEAWQALRKAWTNGP